MLSSVRDAGGGVQTSRFSYDPGWVLAFASSLLLGRRRSFAADSRRLRGFVTPEPRVEGSEFIPRHGSFVLVTNHYYRPGYNMWWGMATIGVAVAGAREHPGEVVWIVANRWTYPDWLRSHVVTPATRVLFTRLARTYGFVSMPPMPPRPQYMGEAVRAVRQALSLAASATVESPVVIAIAPEGGDSPDGTLMQPPSGAGRLMLHLAGHGLPFLPVGVSEVDGVLIAGFGPLFVLEAQPGVARDDLDRAASSRVMAAIGALLPGKLRGVYEKGAM